MRCAPGYRHNDITGLIICKGFRSCGKSVAMTLVKAKCVQGGHNVPGALHFEHYTVPSHFTYKNPTALS